MVKAQSMPNKMTVFSFVCFNRGVTIMDIQKQFILLKFRNSLSTIYS